MTFQLLMQQGWTLPIMKFKTLFTLLMVASLFAVSANGAPVPLGYSVNSDSGSEDQDSLYIIDLPAGIDDLKGKLVPDSQTQRDTEGLAFDADGVLWGIDDLTLTLFRINTTTGAILFQDERSLKGLPTGGGNDFGMTFSCDNTLYITSVVTNTLYELDLEGNTQVIGNLNAPISAIAAIGSPTKIYGLGNGLDQDGKPDSPNLYSINTDTGAASLIGALGAGAGAYNQAGLAFDNEGTLWAITDRRGVNKSIDGLPSQVLRLNMEDGSATWVADTNEVGFESLAIASPANCAVTARADNWYAPIPTMSQTGLLLTIFVLMLSGLLTLRKRLF